MYMYNQLTTQTETPTHTTNSSSGVLPEQLTMMRRLISSLQGAAIALLGKHSSLEQSERELKSLADSATKELNISRLRITQVSVYVVKCIM